MGYYTYYEITIRDYGTTEEISPDKYEEIMKYLRDYSEGAQYTFEEDGSTYDISKWYTQEPDMYWISRLYPDHLFTLFGDGDASDDVWVEYWLDGKVQHEGRISTPPFDEEELEPYKRLP